MFDLKAPYILKTYFIYEIFTSLNFLIQFEHISLWENFTGRSSLEIANNLFKQRRGKRA